MRRSERILICSTMVLTIPGCTHTHTHTHVHTHTHTHEHVERSTDSLPIDTLIMMSPCDSLPPLPGVAEALTGGTTFENEIHDCQRIINRVGVGEAARLEFGPLIGVFPLDAAMNYSDQDLAAAVPIATIVNWGGPVPASSHAMAFKMDPGWYCLWVRGGSGQWRAVIVPTSVPCDSTVSNPPPTPEEDPQLWTNLGLRRYAPFMNRSDLPPTARLGWDHHHDIAYIGIRCGQHWCFIGPTAANPDFEPTTGLTPNTPSTITGRLLAPGYYDEQHLAVFRGDSMVPGPWALIMPTDSLLSLEHADSATASDAFDGEVPAALISVVGDAQSVLPYGTKFNLAFANGTGTSEVWLSLGELPVAHFRGAMPQRTTYNVRHLPVTRHASAGAVRWRWHSADETAWISCRSGCCDVQP